MLASWSPLMSEADPTLHSTSSMQSAWFTSFRQAMPKTQAALHHCAYSMPNILESALHSLVRQAGAPDKSKQQDNKHMECADSLLRHLLSRWLSAVRNAWPASSYTNSSKFPPLSLTFLANSWASCFVQQTVKMLLQEAYKTRQKGEEVRKNNTSPANKVYHIVNGFCCNGMCNSQLNAVQSLHYYTSGAQQTLSRAGQPSKGNQLSSPIVYSNLLSCCVNLLLYLDWKEGVMTSKVTLQRYLHIFSL